MELAPQDFRAHDSRTLVLHKLGKLDDAEAAARQAIALDPTQSLPYIRLASIASARKNYQGAIEFAQKAVELHSKNGLYFPTLGSSQAALGQIEEAHTSYRTALELMPHRSDGFTHLARFLAQYKHDLPTAVDLLESSLKKIPSNPSEIREIATYFRDLGMLERSLQLFDHAASLDPSQSETYVRRGWAYFLQGSVPNATNDLLRALDLDPEARSAHYSWVNSTFDWGTMNDL